MSIVKNTQNTLNITKLQKIVILMILLTTSFNIVRIYIHIKNQIKKVHREDITTKTLLLIK